MTQLSSELHKIIRENSQDDASYQAILDAIKHVDAPYVPQTNYLRQLHQLSTSRYEHIEDLYQAYLSVGCKVLGISKSGLNHVQGAQYSRLAAYPDANKLPTMPLSHVLCNHVVRERKTIAFQDIRTVKQRLTAEDAPDDNSQSYIGTPIYVNQHLYGTICFYDNYARSRAFSELEIEFVELMAQGIGREITERQNQRLRLEAEARYSFIFKSMDVPILLLDDETRKIIDANPAAIKFYGYSREEFLDLSIFDINMRFPADIDQVISDAQRDGIPYVRFPHRLKSGEIREVEAYVSFVKLLDRTIRVAIVYDYSERHRAEVALQRSEANLRAIFDNASQLMMLVDDTSKIVAMNRAAIDLSKQLWGSIPKEGDSIYDYIPLARQYDASDHFDQVLNGKSIEHEVNVTLENGEVHYVAYRYVPVLTDEGNIIGVCITGENITSLKMSERDLQQERNILRTLIDNVPDVIYIKDTEARIVTANAQYALVARSKSSEELVGKTDLDLYPQYGERYYKDDIDVLESGESIINLEEPVILPDNSAGWFMTTKVPLRDSENRIVGLVGVGRDITLRKQFEDALYRRDIILNTISDSAQLFLREVNWRESIPKILEGLGIVLGVSRVYVFQNSLTDKGLGAAPLYEWTIEGVQEHGDFVKWGAYDWGFSRWEATLSSGGIIAGHVTDFPQSERDVLQPRDNMSMAVVPVMLGQDWWGFMGFDTIGDQRDWPSAELDVLMTAASTLGAAIQREQFEQGLRDNEEKFNQLATHIPEVLWIRDLESDQVLYVSPAYETIFGVSLNAAFEQEILPSSFFHPEDVDMVKNALDGHFDEEPVDFEARIIRTDVGTRWIRIRTFPIKNAEGVIYRIAGIATDMTDRKQAEENRLEMLAQRERVAILSNFFRDASHEFKTPLSIINTSLYLLGKADKPDVRSEHYDRIRQQVTILTELVEALLLMSRLDSGTELTFSSINLNSTVRQVESSALDSAEERRPDVRLELSDNMPPVYGHMGYVNRALQNVVDNALRYTPQGRSIVLKTYVKNNYAVIEVADQGIGISSQELPKIFTRFYRGDEAHSTRGFGLGLPIARKIMQEHGGDILVDSNLDLGSTFRMIFPLANIGRR